ncbi:hypothetical protein [Ruegeria sp.]|uniref:hypothetical protein n=1 Tax=Ruegeria sp. TaxID=1879320 RepID=UPI003B58C29F
MNQATPDLGIPSPSLKQNRGNRKKAKVALARRIGVVLHRMWMDNTDFRSIREEAMALRAA